MIAQINLILQKHGGQLQGVGQFFLCITWETIKNLLVKNYWADLEIGSAVAKW